MTTSKPEPLFAQVQRPRCPVCGESVYSRAGIHPQCAQERADAQQKERLKASQRTADEPGPDDLKEGRAAGAAAGFVNVFTSCCGTCNSVRYETDEVA